MFCLLLISLTPARSIVTNLLYNITDFLTFFNFTKLLYHIKIPGDTEEKFIEEWNEKIHSKLHVSLNLDAVFIDSWSQQPWNLNDENQQVAFKRETEKLWQYASKNEPFQFR